MNGNILHCIANPHAARGTRKREVEAIQAFFQQHSLPSALYWTEYPHHAMEIAERLVRSGAKRIAALGGDGTAFEVINGMMRSGASQDVSLAILPLGTGNSFLRDYGIASWEEMALRVVRGETRRVDIGQIEILGEKEENLLFFHNMVGMGIVAEACRLRHTRFPWMGIYAYHAAFFNLLLGFKTFPTRIQGTAADSPCRQIPLLVLCNSQYTGHNMRLSPRSNVEDGYMEFMYTKHLSSWELLRLFLGLHTGNHLDHPKVHFESVSSLEVEMKGLDYFMVDGEIVNGNSLRITLKPKALSIFI